MADCCNDRKKVHWTVKLAAFGASVLSLSWFFAGWRQVHQASTPGNWLLLASGVLVTALLLLLQGYWIYFDEKAKGRLRKRIGLYERIHSVLAHKSHSAAGCGYGGNENAQG